MEAGKTIRESKRYRIGRRAEQRQGKGGGEIPGSVCGAWQGSGSLVQSVTASSCWDEIKGKTLRTCHLQEMRCQAGDSVTEAA